MPEHQIKDPFLRGMLFIACIALAVMMVVVCADIILRGVFNHPVRGAYDVVSICLLVMTMFGMGPVIARRGEILIDLIDGLLPRRAVRFLGVVAGLLGIAVFAFCGWSMMTPAKDAWTYGDRSLELGLPIWILWAAAFCGMVGVFWGYLVQLRTRPSQEDTL